MTTNGFNGAVRGSYSHELEIILACARTRLDAPRAESLGSLLQRPVDWEQLRMVARWHRVTGLVFSHLRRPPFSGLVPEELLAGLRTGYLTTVAKHLQGRRELVRILNVLSSEGIQVILLKGAALVGTVYEEPGLRPMADFDLLVPRSRLSDAQLVIQRMGYVPAEDGREEHWALHQHLPKLIGAAARIEVHGHVVRMDGPLTFDIEEFWTRASPTRGDLAGSFLLSPEDMALHLCLNFFRDRRFYSRGAIGQLCDLAETLRTYPLDWEAFAQRARSYRIAGPVACSLRLVQVLLDAPVPEEVVSSLAPAMMPGDLAAFARLRVVTTRSWVTTELVKPQHRYGGVSLMWSIVRRIVPEREYMRLHYGGAGVDSYWRRLGHAGQLLAKFLRRPSELTDDLSVDRWVHGLHESGRPWVGAGSESVIREKDLA